MSTLKSNTSMKRSSTNGDAENGVHNFFITKCKRSIGTDPQYVQIDIHEWYDQPTKDDKRVSSAEQRMVSQEEWDSSQDMHSVSANLIVPFKVVTDNHDQKYLLERLNTLKTDSTSLHV